MSAFVPHLYHLQSRGSISIRRLDDLLSEDVQVMKIDVEGYELEVLQGAKELLSHHTVKYIMAECNTGIIGDAGKDKYLR
jgi:FkbM family methyltransferase